MPRSRRRSSSRRRSGHQDRRLARRRRAGPDRGPARVFTNMTTDPHEVAKAAGLYAVVDSNGKAGVILFTDSIYAIATAKTNADEGGDRGLQGLQGAHGRGHADRRLSNRMGQLDDLAAVEVRQDMDLLDRRERPLFRFLGARRCSRPASTRRPAIRARSRPATARCPPSSASATSSTRSRTVAEPLQSAGLACVDELNRAFAGEQAERLRAAVASVHAGQHRQGRRTRRTSSIPGNGYKDEYKKIWGVK